MAEKILYFLGAGASAQALPLAKSVGTRSSQPEIPGLAHELGNININPLLYDLRDKNYQHLITTHKDSFKELAAKADEFGDVDTYAKYLHLMFDRPIRFHKPYGSWHNLKIYRSSIILG